MIPIETLKRVEVVYTHANCPDGMATAIILKDAFRMLGTSPRIEFLVHNTPEHRAAGSENVPVLFCDIAPHQDLLDGARRVVGGEVLLDQIIVLDHHKGAEDLVRSFGERGVFADEKLEPSVSGAVLAFREVWSSVVNERVLGPAMAKEPGVEVYRAVREFAEACGARDTWQTKDPRFERGQWISKMLMSKPASHWLDSEARYQSGVLRDAPYLFEREVEAGRVLFEAHMDTVRQAVEQCVEFMLEWPAKGAEAGVRLLVFQEQACGFRLCSDVAEAIRARFGGPTVVAGFAYVVDKPGGAPTLLYSLRGLDGFNVAAFAKANGGGGHTAAAGFSVPLNSVENNPYWFIQVCLRKFLHGENK